MTLDQIERSLERLRSRLYRTVNKINKLEKVQKRLKGRSQPETLQPKVTKPVVVPPPKPVEDVTEISWSEMVGDDLRIPAALQRTNAKDEAAKAEILAQQEAAKKIKTQARIGKLKASKTGDTKRMPLQGKAALAKIREGC